MRIEIGRVEAIYRYPVKSMAGEKLEMAQLGWHGIEGDRRLALRRLNDNSGFPWLTATKLPEQPVSSITEGPCRSNTYDTRLARSVLAVPVFE